MNKEQITELTDAEEYIPTFCELNLSIKPTDDEQMYVIRENEIEMPVKEKSFGNHELHDPSYRAIIKEITNLLSSHTAQQWHDMGEKEERLSE